MPRSLQYITMKAHSFCLKLLPHKLWLVAHFTLGTLLIAANSLSGEFKDPPNWSWLDIIGEGALVLFVVTWMMIILATRRPGFITNWLTAGLIGVFIAALQDLLDEFVQMPDKLQWSNWVESFPLGLSILIVGLVLWYREQEQLNHYLHKRTLTLQNSRQLRGDTLLPKLPAFIKTLQQNTATSRVKLIMLHICSESPLLPPMPPSDTGKLRLLISEAMIWNLPQSVKAFHFTGETYGLLLSENTDEKSVMDLVHLLKAMRFNGIHSRRPVLLAIEVETFFVNKSVSEKELLSIISQVQKKFRSKVYINIGAPQVTLHD